jgi:acyl-CoA thioester hydrolase
VGVAREAPAPPEPFRWPLVVPASALDANEHVNNVVYLEWVQAAATAHADACGCTALTLAAGATWVVREHRIRYLRPALGGDELEVRTWVETVERWSSLRRTDVVRRADGVRLVRAATDWALIDRATSRPRRIPAEIAAALGHPPAR